MYGSQFCNAIHISNCNLPGFSTINILVLIQVATAVQQLSCFDTQHIFYKLYTFLYRNVSGGEKRFHISTVITMV